MLDWVFICFLFSFLAPFVLDGAAECLTMLQMDLLDQAILRTAFDGVIHTALLMHDNPASAAAGDARMRLGARCRADLARRRTSEQWIREEAAGNE